MNIYTNQFPSTKAMSYVYRLDHPVTGEFYIGYRMKNVKKNIPSHIDFPKYKTSSKKVKPRFEEFQWYIVAEFFDHKDAYDFEQLLIYENWGNSNLLNKSCFHGKQQFRCSGHTAVAREKIRLGGIGRVVSEETREKIGRATSGRVVSEETREKISRSSSEEKSSSAKTFKITSTDNID